MFQPGLLQRQNFKRIKARSCLCVSVKLVRGMRGMMREQKVVRVRANAQNERIIHGVELIMSKWNESKFYKKQLHLFKSNMF